MQNKLAEVRSKADEARMAKIRSNLALYEGLSAAYDFALDAEDNADEYLKLVEGQGLKIQLRSPMKPVVKLAFDGLCDNSTIAQLEAVLAWALKQDLPRGSLASRIEEEGGSPRCSQKRPERSTQRKRPPLLSGRRLFYCPNYFLALPDWASPSFNPSITASTAQRSDSSARSLRRRHCPCSPGDGCGRRCREAR